MTMVMGSTSFVPGDTFTFNALGPALIELDARLGNTNQFHSPSTIVPNTSNSGTGGLSYAATSVPTNVFNAKYKVQCTAAAGSTGAYTGTLAWAEYGDRVGAGTTGTLNYVQSTSTLTLTLTNGIVLTAAPGASNFAVGDYFLFTVAAPRESYSAKDDRTVNIVVTAASSAVGAGTVGFSFTADTPEGGFGSDSLTANQDNVTSDDWGSGHYTLPGNILIAFRNLFKGPSGATGGNRHVVADAHVLAATLSDEVDWSLETRATETIAVDDVKTDVNGAITGVANTKYILIGNEPEDILSIKDSVTETGVTYLVITSGGDNTRYISLAATPTNPLVVVYNHRGAEPVPGSFYFFTGKYLRPAEFYNDPIYVSSADEGRKLLAPMENTNHLAIMNEIAMQDNGCPGMWIVQVADADGDGSFTDVDFRDAIVASEEVEDATDLVVLGHFGSLSDALASLTRTADPFKGRHRLGWFGMPVGSVPGVPSESGTITNLATQTLRVNGDVQYHGTRILVGTDKATRDIRLENGAIATVELDASFVAGALAAMTASFNDPGESMLLKQLRGFKTVRTYGSKQSPTNLLLGGAQCIYFTDEGAGVYLIQEDITTDDFAPDFENINMMTQKSAATRYIRRETGNKIPGITVDSPEAGVGLVKSFLVKAMMTLRSKGIIGAWRDDDGNERPFDPDTDVIVDPDETDPTLYHFYYAYYLRATIKRLFGLYVVNTVDFGSGG